MVTTPEASEYTSIKERLHPKFELESAVTLQIQQQTLQSFDLSTNYSYKYSQLGFYPAGCFYVYSSVSLY